MAEEITLKEYVVKCGYNYTDDIFIVPANVYVRIVDTTHTVIQHAGGSISHKQTSRDKYLCWNYGTKLTSEITFDTYHTQLNLFNFLKEDNDFIDTLMKEILDQDLSQLASQSALLYSR